MLNRVRTCPTCRHDPCECQQWEDAMIDDLILPTGHTELSRDKRPIRAIHDREEHSACWMVEHNCSAIYAYDENGEMASVPWLAVYCGTELRIRTPARYWTVEYEAER